MNAANGPAAGVDDIRKDLQTLREDVMRLAGQVSTLVGATGDQALGDGKQRMRQMGDAVSDIGERGGTWRLTCSKMSARRLAGEYAHAAPRDPCRRCRARIRRRGAVAAL